MKTPPTDKASRAIASREAHECLRSSAKVQAYSDDQIIGALCDLFAGRTCNAFGEDLEWWAETLQCDLAPEAASGVALVALSKWPFDQRAGAAGVKALQDELLKRARMLIDRSARVIEEVT